MKWEGGKDKSDGTRRKKAQERAVLQSSHTIPHQSQMNGSLDQGDETPCTMLSPFNPALFPVHSAIVTQYARHIDANRLKR